MNADRPWVTKADFRLRVDRVARLLTAREMGRAGIKEFAHDRQLSATAGIDRMDNP